MKVYKDGILEVNRNIPLKLASTNIINDVTFNDVTTSTNSTEVDITQMRSIMYYVSATETGASTTKSILLRPQFKSSDGTWHSYGRGFYVDHKIIAAQMAFTRSFDLPVPASDFRINVIASGTTSSDTITLRLDISGQS